MDVPFHVAVAVSLVFNAEVMLLPGAKMSTQAPKLEKDERASALVVAPTVIAVGSLAGEKLHASRFSLPAATTIVTPAAEAPATAAFTLVLFPPPNDMLATAGFTAF
jgi:hypothetical protein